MPSYRGHLLGYGVIAFAFVLFDHRLGLLPSYAPAAWIVSAAVGGFYTLLPDVDAPASKARKIIEVASLALIAVSLAVYLRSGGMILVHAALFLSALLIVLWMVKHRGIVHTPLAAILFSAPLYPIHPLSAGFGFLGYMTHLILDREVFG